MRFRNHPVGYGFVTKFLHWLLFVAFAALGATILAIGLLRVLWRLFGSLPEWAEGLSEAERRLAHRTERALYWLTFLIPLTGLSLVLASGEEWDLSDDREWQAPLELVDDDILLAAHITTHVVFFIALGLHVGLALKHQFVNRDRLLNRML